MIKLPKTLLFLILLVFVFQANLFADSLLRGFGFDALTVDDSNDLQVLEDLILDHNVNAFRVQYFNSNTSSDFENEEDKGVANYLAWVENTVLPHFAILKQLFDQHGVKAVFSLHSPIGGREASNPPVDRIFDYEDLQAAQIEAWSLIAAVYNSDPNVIYQIFSEPGTTSAKWQSFYRSLIPSIRNIGDTDNLAQPAMLLMPPYGNPSLVRAVDLTDLPEGNYIMGVNMYSPFDYTHQGTAAVEGDEVLTYLSTIVPRDCSRAQKKLKRAIKKGKSKKIIARLKKAYKACNKLRKREVSQAREYSKAGLQDVLDKAIDSASSKNIPLFIPEYAVVGWAPGAAQYLADISDVFDENGISSFYHILFESGVWDPLKECERGTGNCQSVETTDRFEALSDYFSSNEFSS